MECQLEINHQQYLSRLIQETRCLETMDFEVVPTTLALTLQEPRRRAVLAALLDMIERSSCLMRQLDPPEVKKKKERKKN